MWDPHDYEAAATAAVGAINRWIGAAVQGEGPAVTLPSLAEATRDLELAARIEQGGLDIPSFIDAYLERSTRLHHPGELAHQVAAPDVPAAVAELIHGAINNPMSIWEMGPAAAAVEHAVVAWMLAKVGFDRARAGGILTHGGSLANLTALLAARARAAPEAWRRGAPPDLAVLAPSSAHYSVKRAVAILGLGEDALIELDVDDCERILPGRLEAALARTRAAGRRPMALVAAACATSTGLHDDLEAIAGFCERHGIWLHVDAAHGASALLSPKHRTLLAGIERADSVIWDAHKMLRTAALCAAVLVREGSSLRAAFQQEASYLIYGEEAADSVDILDRQIECTKAELGLKLFLNLAVRGERGLGEYVAAQYEKTLRFWELVRRRPGFSCPYRPESNILCFRYGEGSQTEIRERLMKEGRFHLSSTEIQGERYLRLSVMSPATDEATIEQLLGAIERVAGRRGAATAP